MCSMNGKRALGATTLNCSEPGRAGWPPPPCRRGAGHGEEAAGEDEEEDEEGDGVVHWNLRRSSAGQRGPLPSLHQFGRAEKKQANARRAVVACLGHACLHTCCAWQLLRAELPARVGMLAALATSRSSGPALPPQPAWTC